MPVQKKPADINNIVIAFVLSTLILLGWQIFIDAPRKKAEALRQQTQQQAQALTKASSEPEVIPVRTRDQWIADSPRVHISSPRLHGSIALKGLRFDDLTLASYHETLDPKSPEVVLFSPASDANGYFAEFGWLPQDGVTGTLPSADTVWTANGDTLSPQHPLAFSWKNEAGITFTVNAALDDNYMFTLTQSAADAAGKPLAMRHYAYLNRVWDTKTHPAINILHEGPVGVFDSVLTEAPYKKLVEEKDKTFEASNGWMGISDKYWLSAIVPQQDAAYSARFSTYTSKSRQHFQVDYVSPAEAQTTLHFFAGAKELSLLDGYATQYHIPLFDRAVDFGLFWFLAKPIFLMLEYFYALVGNFGIAILILTVLVKLLMFPLASKSFGAMNQMKELQPKLKDIQTRHKDDKLKMNSEVMALYKKEKVNPASGCLPMFIQIPVFFSLYKVLYVSIEMRHAPFYGWIHDLSAPDPTNLFTLFGLIPWTPPTAFHLGVWPILMCATMVIQQFQSPPPPDPVQAKMMKALPFVFLFLFSNVAAGLVIYWTWSNSLSILQQWHIKQSHAKKKAKRVKS